MFDINKLTDMAKIAGEAKKMQEKQERMQAEQAELLRKISGQLEEVLSVLRSRS